jgi:hypothetical protein
MRDFTPSLSSRNGLPVLTAPQHSGTRIFSHAETEILLQEHDEYILESNFLEGIDIYVGLIRSLGSKGEEQ